LKTRTLNIEYPIEIRFIFIFSRKMTSFLNLPDDIKRFIAEKLDFYDVLALSLTSVALYRAMRKIKALKEKACFPFKPHNGKTYKLTIEQCEVLKRMLCSTSFLKLCRGPAGHGKTWLIIAYVFQKYLRFSDEDSCVVFILPTVFVVSFSEFWRDNIQYPALSNCTGSCFYKNNWRELIGESRVFIASKTVVTDLLQGNYLSVRKHAVVMRKTDNLKIGNSLYATNMTSRSEFVIFGGEKLEEHDNCDIFNLKNNTLEVSMLKPEYELYQHVGTTEQGLDNVLSFCKSKTGQMTQEDAKKVITFLARHDLYNLGLYVKRGMMWLQTPIGKIESELHKQNLICLESMKKSPKMMSLVNLAKLLNGKGEKLVIYDTDQSYTVNLYYLLTSHGLNVYPYITKYKPNARLKMLNAFKTDSAGVLIGCIDLLSSDAVNFHYVNNMTFFRYPTKYDDFDKAVTRTSRPGEKQSTKVHLLFTCELEKRIFLSMLEFGGISIPMGKLKDEIEELKEKKLNLITAKNVCP
jgi:hypothetical protein